MPHTQLGHILRGIGDEGLGGFFIYFWEGFRICIRLIMFLCDVGGGLIKNHPAKYSFVRINIINSFRS